MQIQEHAGSYLFKDLGVLREQIVDVILVPEWLVTLDPSWRGLATWEKGKKKILGSKPLGFAPSIWLDTWKAGTYRALLSDSKR